MRTALLSLLALSCASSPLAARFGRSVNTDERKEPDESILIAPKSIKSLSLNVVGKETYCSSGELLQLKVVAGLYDRTSIETWTIGESHEKRLSFNNFTWTTSHGEVDEDGLYHPPVDPLSIIDKDILIKVAVKDRDKIASETKVTPIYSCGATLNFHAVNGTPGTHGTYGDAGLNGNRDNGTGTPYPGLNGTDGKDGSDGKAGTDGPDVSVSVGYITSTKYGRLIIVRAETKDQQRKEYYLLSTEAPAITLIASGGDGGPGGNGGNGGDGGLGAADFFTPGRVGADGGNAANGGSGADGADGGNGGTVTVYYDKRFPELKDLVKIENKGGQGGRPGKAGLGGVGGTGGASQYGTRGNDGTPGVPGKPGKKEGRDGRDGPAVKYVASSASEMFTQESISGVKIAD